MATNIKLQLAIYHKFLSLLLYVEIPQKFQQVIKLSYLVFVESLFLFFCFEVLLVDKGDDREPGIDDLKKIAMIFVVMSYILNVYYNFLIKKQNSQKLLLSSILYHVLNTYYHHQHYYKSYKLFFRPFIHYKVFLVEFSPKNICFIPATYQSIILNFKKKPILTPIFSINIGLFDYLNFFTFIII